MFTAFLIKYAEIAIKGKNRHLFEDALIHQIKYALKKVEGKFCISKTQGRIFVEAQSEFDYDATIGALQHVFGIVGICPMIYVENEGFEKLKETVKTGDTEAIKADTEAVEKAFYKISEKLYSQQAGAQGADPNMGGNAGSDNGGNDGGTYYNANYEDHSQQ